MNTPLTIQPEFTQWSVPRAALGAELAKSPLVVMMHGFGSNEKDLVALGPLLPSGYVTAALRAPISMVQGGYAWQPLGGQEYPTPAMFSDPAEAVLEWLETVEAEYGSTGTSTVLLGFSQGAAMVGHLFRIAPQRFSAGVFLSGFIGNFTVSTDVELAKRRPPLFWGRDTSDPVITSDSVAFASEFLPAHFNLTERTYRGIGHGISRDEVEEVSAFLTDAVIAD